MLSEKGQQKLVDRIADNYVRILRRQLPQRPALIIEILEELLRVYNKENKNGSANSYIESIKRPVVALNPKTGELVKRYESIRDAWRQTKVYHGTIYHCVAHDRPKGYRTAGGFKWMYEEEWLKQK